MSSKLRRAANAWSLVFIATVASLYKVADLGRSPSCSPSNFHVVRLTRYSMPMVYQRHGSFCNDDEPNPDQQRASIARRRHRRERWQEPERARIRSAARPHAERRAAGGHPAAGAPAGGCLADIAHAGAGSAREARIGRTGHASCRAPADCARDPGPGIDADPATCARSWRSRPLRSPPTASHARNSRHCARHSKSR